MSNSNRKKAPDSPVSKQPLSRSYLIFENKWAYGLCDLCNDVPTTTFAICCYPCFSCCLASNARECGLTLCGTGCGGLGILRSKLRGRYRIEGSIIEDFFYAVCCPCCTALQMHKELIHRGEITKL